ncbi:hypothetical protein MKW98_025851 [Papaver atlanticum]|uniref:Uncharacterized protein n=1 Tax=Papaver atlanticum TaxID=357466 RepID=A0AAD4RUT8_9MAGN|nr:hypothetical protein MKW98_025851 [Papaver atlanticum]
MYQIPQKGVELPREIFDRQIHIPTPANCCAAAAAAVVAPKAEVKNDDACKLLKALTWVIPASTSNSQVLISICTIAPQLQGLWSEDQRTNKNPMSRGLITSPRLEGENTWLFNEQDEANF